MNYNDLRNAGCIVHESALRMKLYYAQVCVIRKDNGLLERHGYLYG